MTCGACHEECNDSCSGPVSIKYVVTKFLNVYNRSPQIVLADVRTLPFLLLITQLFVFHNVY